VGLTFPVGLEGRTCPLLPSLLPFLKDVPGERGLSPTEGRFLKGWKESLPLSIRRVLPPSPLDNSVPREDNSPLSGEPFPENRTRLFFLLSLFPRVRTSIFPFWKAETEDSPPFLMVLMKGRASPQRRRAGVPLPFFHSPFSFFSEEALERRRVALRMRGVLQEPPLPLTVARDSPPADRPRSPLVPSK